MFLKFNLKRKIKLTIAFLKLTLFLLAILSAFTFKDLGIIYTSFLGGVAIVSIILLQKLSQMFDTLMDKYMTNVIANNTLVSSNVLEAVLSPSSFTEKNKTIMDEISVHLEKLKVEAYSTKDIAQSVVEKSQKTLMIDAYIPNRYASDGDKIELYQEIDGVDTLENLDELEKKVKDIYGKIPPEVERLFNKKRFIILLSNKEVFNDMQEYKDCVDIRLSSTFSSINGIGIKMFKELSSYLSYIKATFLNKELKIRFTKKGDWLPLLIKIIHKITILYENLK